MPSAPNIPAVDDSNIDIPSLKDIDDALLRLRGKVLETPAVRCRAPEYADISAADTEIILKLELFQHTGTFKARGALTNVMALSPDALAKGVTAVSAGNHAIATAYAAHTLGTSAKVVMLSTASRIRIDKCRAYGAEVVLCDDIHGAFGMGDEIAEAEGRSLIHPFEGRGVALGTGTLGLEFIRQAPELDAVIVPIGGGGLCAGVSAAMKQAKPDIEVYGVEPRGADSMTRSFKAGTPQKIDRVRTIADSLGAPHAAPYSFALCRRFVDEIVLIDDVEMIAQMQRMQSGLKLAVEPAGASAMAALAGPLREKLFGKKVGIIVCGSNISSADYCRLLSDEMA